MDQIDMLLAPFGRNNLSNVFDVLLDFAYLRMNVTNQIVLRLRKLFNAHCHFMQLSQQRILPGRDAMHPPKAHDPTERSDAAKQQRHRFEVLHKIS
jgi:hypothetical protein